MCRRRSSSPAEATSYQLPWPVDAEAFAGLAQAVSQAAPGTRLVAPTDAPEELVGDDGRVAVALLHPPVVPGDSPYAAALEQEQAAVAEAATDELRLSIGGTPPGSGAAGATCA